MTLSNCLHCGHPVIAHPGAYVAYATQNGCSECGCLMTAVGAQTPRRHVHDNACRTESLYCPDRVTTLSNCRHCRHLVTAHPGAYVVDASMQGCSECGCSNRIDKVVPDLHTIIENHRAVCTATAEQISDLESQLQRAALARLESIAKEARGQLDTLLGRQVVGWHEANPVLSALVDEVDRG